MSDPKLIKITIQNTDTILFEGTADRITSFNEMGRFDVYPMHANFISILRKELALYQKNQKFKEFNFEQAVMKVKKDVVDIYLGIEVLLIEELNDPSSSPQNPGK
jgi:hypothetical protein